MILVDGQLVDIPGVITIPPASHGGPGWNQLKPDDYRPRGTSWIRQIGVHTTGGKWPQSILPGAGPSGHARQILEMWSGEDGGDGDRVHSGAQIVVDFDGDVYGAVDLVRCAAYHAEGMNDWSIGIEMCTRADGGIYHATLSATCAVITWLVDRFTIPRWMPLLPYANKPLRGMESGTGATRKNLGGPSMVGVFGHRSNTERRGRGDPGDAVFDLLAFRQVDYDGGEDLWIGKQYQETLNALGERLTVDGVLGPASNAALRRRGFQRWDQLDGHASVDGHVGPRPRSRR